MKNHKANNNKNINSSPTESFSDSDKQAIGQIGPYRLLSVLGEGGFSIVYLAEQERPVKRRAALKVIKPGMDTKQVIARFEAERQALALLDHPNIAPVYYAGTTESGLPYFVMEHVKGIPITEHCDRHRLNITQRLELFLQICDAVQYAHQKGIIHRDIKPSNILVTIQGEKAVPKIIDFGVAKAMIQPLTERTLYTEQGQFVGTPEYMSPEQAEMGAQDIDTRSDVYSLGVLLYELLTGTLPFDSKDLRQGGIAHIRQIISEQEPKKPSTRLINLGDEAIKIAENRNTTTNNLTRHLGKELEWIPLMAMRKERTRRYRSASELADDIRNYLHGVPLIAGPESTGYRLYKFVQRNKSLVGASIAVLLVLSAGIIVSTIFAIMANQSRYEAIKATNDAIAARSEAERQAKIAQDVSDFLRNDLLATVDSSATQSGEMTVRSFLDSATTRLEGKFDDEPLVEASIRQTLGTTYFNIYYYGLAEAQLLRAYYIRDNRLGPNNVDTLKTMQSLAMVYIQQGMSEQAEEYLKKRIEGTKAIYGDNDPNTLYAMNDLALLYTDKDEKEYAKAAAIYDSILTICNSELGEENPNTILFTGYLATVYTYQNRYEDAEQLYKKAIANSDKAFGENNINSYYPIYGLGMLYLTEGSYDKAEEQLHKALDIIYTGYAVDTTDSLNTMYAIGRVYLEQAKQYKQQGNLEQANEKYTDAEQYFLDTYDGRVLMLGENNRETINTLNSLIEVYEDAGRTLEAQKWKDKLNLIPAY